MAQILNYLLPNSDLNQRKQGKSSSNLSGCRWTLKIDDLPLMSGGPEREKGTGGQGRVTFSRFTRARRTLSCLSALHTRLPDQGQSSRWQKRPTGHIHSALPSSLWGL